LERPQVDKHANVPRPGPRYMKPKAEVETLRVVNPAGRMVIVAFDSNEAVKARARREDWRLATKGDSSASRIIPKPPKGVHVKNAEGRRVNVTDPQVIAAAKAKAHGWSLANAATGGDDPSSATRKPSKVKTAPPSASSKK